MATRSGRSNRIYIGEIHRKKQTYAGRHESIVSRSLWDRVATLLLAKNRGRRQSKSRPLPSPGLLTGKLFDLECVRFTPTASKKKNRLYRYYTSQTVIKDRNSHVAIKRPAATEIEQAVRHAVQGSLQTPNKPLSGIRSPSVRELATVRLKRLVAEWRKLDRCKQDEVIRGILHRVAVGPETISIHIDRNKLLTNPLFRFIVRFGPQKQDFEA